MVNPFARCLEDWDLLCRQHRSLKILVTGGSGFFGSWLIDSFRSAVLAKVPIQVTLLSREPGRLLGSGFQILKGDVTNFEVPNGITHIFHFASPERQSPDVHSVIVDGTANVLHQAKVKGVRRVLFASSGAIYDNEKTNGAIEDKGTDSGIVSSYGLAKREAEALCVNVSRLGELETVIARGFAFSGAYLSPKSGFALSDFFLQAIENNGPVRVNSPNSVRSYLDGSDLATALWRLMSTGSTGNAYNVGSDLPLKLCDVAKYVSNAWANTRAKISAKPNQSLVSQLNEVPSNLPNTTPGVNSAPEMYWPRIEKIKNLGWNPKIEFSDSLERQALWLARTYSQCNVDKSY